MMMKKVTSGLIVTLVLAGVSLAGPTVVFEDDFNDEPVTGTNVTPEAWVVGGGTVDVIGEGTPWDFFPGEGYGNYIDLDGSTLQAGVLATKDAILFQAGCTYTLTFDLAGSQRWGDQLTETVTVGFVDAMGAPLGMYTRERPDPFSTETVVIPGDGLYHQIFFYNMDSYDNKGALLDNVVLTEECDDPCPVPAPGAVLLGSLGAALVGFFRRRSL